MITSENDLTQKKKILSARRSKRIVMVPRKQTACSEKKFSSDFIFASLNTPPNKRSSWQIDSLTDYFMNSPEFLKIAKNKREVRELSKSVELEFFNPNSVLFSVGDSFDGIYFIFKGEVALLREKEDPKVISSNSVKLPTGSNNSVRHHIFKYEFEHKNENRNDQHEFLRENDTSTSTSDDNDSIPSSHLSSYQRTDIQPPSYSIPLMTTNLLECRFGFGKKFEVIDLKLTNSIIGADSNKIKKQKPWPITAIVTEPSYIIRIEFSIYRKTISYLRKEEQINIAKFLEEILEFDPILYQPELFERLSQVMRTIFIPKGTKRLPIQLAYDNINKSNNIDGQNLGNSWYVIKSGSIGRYRKVDFDQISIDERALFVGSIKIKIPKGVKLIQTETYGPKHCIADSSLSTSLNKPYELKFLEDTIIYAISYNDVKDIVPYMMRKEIEKALLNDPSDDELIRSWCEKEIVIQWQIYRHKITKETKIFWENDRIMNSGEVTCRRPPPPKQIKDHQLSCKNPRFRACREIRKLKEQTEIDLAPSFRRLTQNQI